MPLMVSRSIRFHCMYSLNILVRACRWIADYHPSDVPLLRAAEQREGVVPAPTNL